jgi:hypothetical protein
MVNLAPPDEFECVGLNIMGRRNAYTTETSRRRFASWFGTEPLVCSILWKKLVHSGWFDHAGMRGTDPKHLLWTLLFLKCYATESVNSAIVGVDEKTYRKWIWFYMEGMTQLHTHIVSTSVLITKFVLLKPLILLFVDIME